MSFESEWGIARLDQMRSLSPDAKAQIERIYREEIDPRWLPNKGCGSCYLPAIKRLIELYEL